MGGSNSGRWGWHARRATLEEAPRRLAVRDVKRAAAGLGPADDARGLWGWPGGSTAAYELGPVDAAGRRTLTLTYTLRPPYPPPLTRRAAGATVSDAGDTVRLVLPVLIDAQRIGDRTAGARWWFWCSGCQSRRAAVYLAPGARLYRCRVCARLGYLSKLGGPTGRADRACVKAARRLGRAYFGEHFAYGGWAPRPKGMRRATYARLVGRLADADGRRDELYLAGAMRIINRVNRGWRYRP